MRIFMPTKITNYTFESGYGDEDSMQNSSTIGFCKERPLEVLRDLYHRYEISEFNSFKLGTSGLVIASTKAPTGTKILGNLRNLNFSGVRKRRETCNRYSAIGWIFDHIPRYPPNPTFSDTLPPMTHRQAFSYAIKKNLISREMLNIVSIALKRPVNLKKLESLVNEEWADEFSLMDSLK